MEKLIEILNNIKPDVDFTKEKHLIEDGILASFDIVSLVAAIDEEFDVEISVTDIIPENFESAEAIMNLIKRLED